MDKAYPVFLLPLKLINSVFWDAVCNDFHVEVKVAHDACVERCVSSLLSHYRQLLWLVAKQPHLCTKTEPSWGGLVCQSARPSGGVIVNVWVCVEGLLSLLYVCMSWKAYISLLIHMINKKNDKNCPTCVNTHLSLYKYLLDFHLFFYFFILCMCKTQC